MLSKSSPFLAILALTATLPASAGPIGELSLHAGGIWPQAAYTRFADPGVLASVRGVYHVPRAEVIQPWGELSFARFKSDSRVVDVLTQNLILPAKETTDEYNFALHAGLQIGSPSRLGFFRPRVALAPGFYVFNQDVSRELLDFAEPLDSHSLMLGRIGWRGIGGADFFFSRKWGLSFEYLYDQAYKVQGNGTASYQGFSLGLVIPTETIEEQ